MLLRVSRLSCRRAPAVAHARSLGFFADLKKKVGEEFSKNEALQKSLEELRQHDAVKGAGEAARSAAEAIKQAKAKAADLASEAKSKVSASQLFRRAGRVLNRPHVLIIVHSFPPLL